MTSIIMKSAKKIKIINSYVLTIILCFFIEQTVAQTTPDDSNLNDLQTWSSLELDYKINKKLTINLEEQLRLKDNSKVADQYFTQLNIKYKVFKKVVIAVGGRYINENDTNGKMQGYKKYFRLQFGLIYKYKLNRFSLQHRFRYQNKNKLWIDDDYLDVARFKTSISYNIKKWKLDPKISGELFNSLEKNSGSGLKKYRLGIETQYGINEALDLSIFYKIDKEINTVNPKTTNIIGLKLTYNYKI